MYRNFYGLAEPPFTIAPDPRFLYLSEAHREALARLRYGILERKGFVVITGEVGTGKTTLVHALLADLPQQTRVAFISNPKLTAEEFFFLVANAFSLGTFRHKAEFILRFKEFLGRAYRAGDNVVLIVDEAHCLPPELMEEIRLLSNLEIPHHRMVNIFLVGQPELRERLATPEMLPLRQRISLHYHLPSLTLEETARYIETRLLHVGAMDLGLFTPQAVEAIHKHTRGLPRLINILADHALLTGYVKELRQIDDSVIKECAREVAGAFSERTSRRRGDSPTAARGKRPWPWLSVSTAAVILGIVSLWATALDEDTPAPEGPQPIAETDPRDATGAGTSTDRMDENMPMPQEKIGSRTRGPSDETDIASEASPTRPQIGAPSPEKDR